MVKDKKTNLYNEQEKKKPTPTVPDQLVGKDQWAAAIYMVNRLRNRFSDELHIAMTIFIDYLVRQFSEAAINNCRESGKARVYVCHLLNSMSKVELAPLVKNFTTYKDAVCRQERAKLNGVTAGPQKVERAEEDEEESKKKHRFSYCICGVCKNLIEEIHKRDANTKQSKIIISSEYKQFMCELIDEFISRFGPILRREITSNDVKTVNLGTFYSVLSVLLGWECIDVDSIKSYIDERIKRHETFTELRAEERKNDRSNGVNPGSEDVDA